MKKIIVKFFVFLKKEHLSKYMVEIGFFALVLVAFLIFSTSDVISNVVGTIIGFVFSTVILYIFRVVSANLEDMLKVNKDTQALLRVYKGAPEYRKRLELNGTQVEFAYADCLVDRGYTYDVVDQDRQNFALDDFILENYDTLFSAHTGSTKINSTTVRLDDVEKNGDHVTFHLSRSTVFNHLVTNRAIDFIIFDSVTLRDMYEYGPRLRPLKDSKMSNHVGINALVFLSDGALLVPRRNKASTISKNQITSSIAVKLDFPGEGTAITADYLIRGNILDNLTKRLHIAPEDLHPEAIDIRFLGMGQSIYEGGKPQFYYSVVLNDMDTQRYYKLSNWFAKTPQIDVDRCIYVADYSTFRFKKDYVTFEGALPNKRRHRIKVKYEMSYLCNLWHYEESRK